MPTTPKEHRMSEQIPPLDLSGQDDDGDQSQLTAAHLEQIASPQEEDPQPDRAPVDSILDQPLEEADDE